MAKVLEDVRVLEMGTFITGPAAGMLLADLGADVVKIENPEAGDPFRAFKGGLYSPHFQTYNRNKKSITLNSKLPEDLAALDRLVADADVFIQNFRPGVADRLNVDPARLQAINPRLIYCSISGFGATGPDRKRPAFDTVAQAASGFLRLLINPKHPRVIGPAIADSITGFYAAYGILGALHERERTGRGRLVEVSMLEAMCHFNLDDFTHYFSAGQVMGPYSRPNVSQSYVFQCADDGWIALHMSSPAKFWEALADVVGRPDMLSLPEFADRNARINNYDGVVAFLAPIFRTRDRADWQAALAAREVPSSPVYASNEALQTEQARLLEIEIAGEHPETGPFRTIRSPVSFDGERARTVVPPPVLGEHNEEILGRPAWRAAAE
ncbi:MAG: carnitine dehydratase [Sphingomonas sp. SCN 67-18]|uniref:CaiB/BaiF CoA transferase family protein n=1 Tax=uncultured Sphingomonas sp. TaxID=158754 RepID=UPI00086F16A5|nr:CoA transferase [Sphingomonas sp. SCN 67-18]ODU22936.1 MAG: carnitine dehydratase [Sphingomonas sp. SCN 67-18]